MSATNARELAVWADVPPRLARITVRAAAAHGLTLATLRSDSRKRPLFRCRQSVATQARKEGFSFPQIGRALNRDHSTVIYAVRAA